MSIQKMPAALFAEQLRQALARKDGYIMGAKGQNPKIWSPDGGMFTQYSGRMREKALYWREHAQRVWDCNGLAEGIYQDWSGVNINTRARYNYSGWCGRRGKGMIPPQYRMAGAAVFLGHTAGSITHVMFLTDPVEKDHPEGDWYLTEARGVMYGVVRTRLSERKPRYWGLMDKYFDYGESASEGRILRNGCEGEDVKTLQSGLIRLGFDCGRWGADGDFGDSTEAALRAFQEAFGAEIDGEYGPESAAAMDRALAALEGTAENPRRAVVEGGQCWIREEPRIGGRRLGVAKEGQILAYAGQVSEDGWILTEKGWISGRYGRLI